MTHDFLIGGVMISPIVPACALALVATMILSALLVRIGFYHLVWHRPLVEVAMFCIFLAAVTLLFGEAGLG